MHRKATYCLRCVLQWPRACNMDLLLVHSNINDVISLPTWTLHAEKLVKLKIDISSLDLRL